MKKKKYLTHTLVDAHWFVTVWTDTEEGTNQILAVVATFVGVRLAFINICASQKSKDKKVKGQNSKKKKNSKEKKSRKNSKKQ